MREDFPECFTFACCDGNLKDNPDGCVSDFHREQYPDAKPSKRSRAFWAEVPCSTRIQWAVLRLCIKLRLWWVSPALSQLCKLRNISYLGRAFGLDIRSIKWRRAPLPHHSTRVPKVALSLCPWILQYQASPGHMDLRSIHEGVYGSHLLLKWRIDSLRIFVRKVLPGVNCEINCLSESVQSMVGSTEPASRNWWPVALFEKK